MESGETAVGLYRLQRYESDFKLDRIMPLMNVDTIECIEFTSTISRGASDKAIDIGLSACIDGGTDI